MTFNRGSLMQGSTRTELKLIREAIAAGKWGRVPELIRQSKRVWQNTDLEKQMNLRRDAEAKLFEEGLSNP
jgi:hypothetical protein